MNPYQEKDDDEKIEIEETDESNKKSDVIYPCEFRDFTAPVQFWLENHTLNQHPLNCPYCPEVFQSKTQCRKHYRLKHRDE